MSKIVKTVTRKKLTSAEKFQKLVSQVSDKALIDSFIVEYQTKAKNAVEGIVDMAETVYQINAKYRANTIEQADLDYFCLSVGLNPGSSTFRKFKMIGENASKFRESLRTFPASYTILYEITTLNADVFEYAINNNLIQPTTTLNDIKTLANKALNNRAANDDSLKIVVSIDKSKLSEETACVLKSFLDTAKACADIKVNAKAFLANQATVFVEAA